MRARLLSGDPRAPWRAIPVQKAELGEPPHGGAVFLVEPGELQPELALRDRRSGVAADDEHAQRRVARAAERMDARLQRAQLLQSAARQDSDRTSLRIQLAHVRSDSISAVAWSSSAITSQ